MADSNRPLRAAVVAAALLASGCGSGLGEVGWLGGDERAFAGHGPLRVGWTKRLTPEYEGPFVPIERSVAALDPPRNRIYVGSSAGMLYALNSGGGRLYRYDAAGAIESQPALDAAADELYVGTEQGEIHALSASDGQLRWRDHIGGPIRRDPVLTDDAVYVITDTDEIAALGREDGDTLWGYEREAPEGFSISGHSGLTRHGNVLLAGFTDGMVVALDLGDGRVVWDLDTSLDVDTDSGEALYDVDTTPVIVGDKIIVASYSAGLYVIDADSGTVVERAPEWTAVTGISHAGDHLVLASGDHGVVCLAAEDLRELWRHPIARGAPTEPIVSAGAILVGESQGSFLAIALVDGEEIGRFDTGHGFTARATVADGLGFVVANSGNLYSFSIR